MDLYAENILDHYRHPRGKTEIADATVKHGEENHSCGDKLTVELKINDEKISQIGWSGDGCAISQAAMSIMSEELIGKTADEISTMKPKQLYEMLGVPIGPRRFKCALLCLHTMKNALRKAKKEELLGWIHTVAVEDN